MKSRNLFLSLRRTLNNKSGRVLRKNAQQKNLGDRKVLSFMILI